MASILVHVSEAERRVLNSDDICYAKGEPDGVMVYSDGGEPLRDLRQLGAIEASWGQLGLLRIDSGHLVNPDRVYSIRRAPGRDLEWELQVGDANGEVLPIERKYLPAIWKAYGER